MRKPVKPEEPKKNLIVPIEVPLEEFDGCTLKEVMDAASLGGMDVKDLSQISINVDYCCGEVPSTRLIQFQEKENTEYQKQLERYNEKLEKYKNDLKKWKEWDAVKTEKEIQRLKKKLDKLETFGDDHE